jgi:hypothetical protein
VITEAVDTAITLAWTLLVWVAILSAIGTLLLLGAVAVVAWGVSAAWRALSRRLRAEVPENELALLRPAERRSGGRLRLRSTRDPLPDPPATDPSRPKGTSQTAPQTPGGGFPAPDRHKPPESRSGARDHHDYEETA